MSEEEKLSDWGEDRLVARLSDRLPLADDVVVGPGDDCAVLRFRRSGSEWQLLKTDVVVEGVHFDRHSPPAAVGWKAAARAVSDVAAMGGSPAHAVVTVVAPRETSVAWMTAVYRGLLRCARTFSFSIVGGETSGAPTGSPRMINVSMTGRVNWHHCVLRSGAKVGDWLWVTGRLGGSLGSGRHLRFQPRLDEARWLARHFRPTAMMDLSDGLGRDLPRLARASGVGWVLDLDRLPRHRGCTTAQALGDGEDFELLFSMSPRRAKGLAQQWSQAFPRLPVTAIGVVAEAGRQSPGLDNGFEHFAGTGDLDAEPGGSRAG